MKSGLKKSLYFGLAAVSVLAAGSFVTTSNASAKTYAKVSKIGAAPGAAEARNVASNGTNALYTKAGTLRGARVVASKSTMAALGNSKSSANYFRAYRYATTNRGSVYFKVVSFNGKYRGWIYGGKSIHVFAGGIASAKTTQDAKLPTQLTGYTLVNQKKNTLWSDPQNTQYKAAKVDMSAYKSTDTFTVSGAETKTREGSLYYKVTDDQTPSITGWIYYGGVKAPQGNSVKINYVDKDTGKSVGTGSLPFDKSATTTNATETSNLKSIVSGIPSGYVPYSNNNGGSASFDNASTAAVAKNGDTVTYYVKAFDAANSTKNINISVVNTEGNSITLKPNDSDALTASGAKAQFQVKLGDNVTASDVEDIIADANLRTLVGNDGVSYTFDHADSATTTTSTNTVNVKAYYKIAY
ncbi:S-layer protein [Secundilactobacillus folii]|uniref:S-layer protein n=1 Tax=Secundilactobacillus folii TaxID=2678357 RepID=A0A7X2XV49_9LACO|nr:S-layer protein [Secundilactobacillus folii]MTV82204.1 S-layer protein [Secundilactobacillus folii]